MKGVNNLDTYNYLEDSLADSDIDAEDAAPEQDDELLEEKILTEASSIKLDYKLKTLEERNELVKKIVNDAPPGSLSPDILNCQATISWEV